MIEFNTFSITARDPVSGALGVAVSTARPCIGALSPFVRARVGAICSQAFLNPYLGIDGMKLLEQGSSAHETLDRVLAGDEYREIRQLAIVDANGEAAAFSGSQCVGWYGDIVGDGFAVAGNMLIGEATLREMRREFLDSTGEDLPERLMRALEAAQSAGGDRRGKQSAALYVATTEEYGYVDIRVDDNPDPVTELRRVFEVVKREFLPFVSQLPTRANPKGNRTPETAAEYGRQLDTSHPLGTGDLPS